MKAIVNIKSDGGSSLELRNVPEPEPGPHDLLVKVRAVGLNRADLSRNMPRPDDPDFNIAGMETAGEVIATGREVKDFEPGDRVMSMGTKAYAEQALADSRVAMKIPGNLDFAEAAAIPTFFSTAHDALVTNGELAKGSSLLIQGAAAGVGIAMIQAARALGASVIAGTSRDATKLGRLKAFGLDVAIQSGTDDTAELCKAATDGKGVDVVSDNIGKGVLTDNLEAAAIKGRIVSVGRLGGKIEEIDLDKIALKRLKLIGVTFRTRTVEEKADITRRLIADLGTHFANGSIKPPIDRTFDFDEALAAQEYMRSNGHIGKIVLKL